MWWHHPIEHFVIRGIGFEKYKVTPTCVCMINDAPKYKCVM
jgi:hypothetical protein